LTICHLHFNFSASIISKKVAEGTKTLVMDVKVGSAAFFKDEAKARNLASVLVS
jgi:thymidine phosphorylase